MTFLFSCLSFNTAWISNVCFTRVEGSVLTQFVVDTAGMADPTTLKVLKSTHELFVQAVSRALPDMRFLPAQVGGRSVKQLVELPFVFQIAGDRGGSAERSSAGQIREMPPATSATSNTVRRIGTVIITAVPGDPKPPR